MTRFDEKAYWRRRHDEHSGRLRAVGIDTIPDHANSLAYRQLARQYERLLDRLDLPSGTTALDAGAGVGTYTRLLHERGFDVTALDISQSALDGIDLPITKVCAPIADAGFSTASFHYVHSFDVIYHIMDDDEWAASLTALARWSARYVVLHERFTRLPQWLPSKIMKMRSRKQTASVLADQGFRAVMTMPTFFAGKHLLTYRLFPFAPDLFYRLDEHVLGRHDRNRLVQELSSHRIKVFERG